MTVGAAPRHFALPRLHPGLRDVNVYLGWAGSLSRVVQAVSAGTSLLGRVPGARGGRRRDPAPARARIDRRAGRRGAVAASARWSSPRRSTRAGPASPRSSCPGVNPYDFTAAVLAWGAQAAADGGLQGAGALGPVDAFGLEALVRGCAEAGIARV